MQNRGKNDEEHYPSTFRNGTVNLKEHRLNKIDNSSSNSEPGGKLPTHTWHFKELHLLYVTSQKILKQ